MPAIPLHERISLTAEALAIGGHIDGIALYFGPGPAVWVLQPTVFGAIRAKALAREALELLTDTLAKASNRKEA